MRIFVKGGAELSTLLFDPCSEDQGVVVIGNTSQSLIMHSTTKLRELTVDASNTLHETKHPPFSFFPTTLMMYFLGKED
jgi:hypothetical protein